MRRLRSIRELSRSSVFWKAVICTNMVLSLVLLWLFSSAGLEEHQLYNHSQWWLLFVLLKFASAVLLLLLSSFVAGLIVRIIFSPLFRGEVSEGVTQNV